MAPLKLKLKPKFHNIRMKKHKIKANESDLVPISLPVIRAVSRPVGVDNEGIEFITALDAALDLVERIAGLAIWPVTQKTQAVNRLHLCANEHNLESIASDRIEQHK